MLAGKYSSIVEQLQRWSESEADVRTVLIVGSQARTGTPADEWSDLDVAIFHTFAPRLLASTEWFRRFGEVVLSMTEPTAVGGNQERRVLYSDGRDVDYAIFPSTAIPFLTSLPEGRRVLARGFIVLADKDHQLEGLPAQLAGEQRTPGAPPTEEVFEADVADFWYHVLWVAKKLRRGELWAAKMGCDGYLKRLLVRMIEWDATVRSEGRTDVWHDGRFLDRWAPADIRDRLPSTFALYASSDLARALRETGRLYSELAVSLAQKSGWTYPTDAEASVWSLVDRTLENWPAP